jgi:hypothetical protein
MLLGPILKHKCRDGTWYNFRLPNLENIKFIVEVLKPVDVSMPNMGKSTRK